MQHLPRKIFRNARRINFVAEHGVTEMMKMNADLMGASAVQPALNQTCLLAGADYPILGLSRPSAHGSHLHSLSMDRMSSDFFFDYPGRLKQFSRDKREINLFHCPRGKLFGQFAMCDIIFRHYKAAACVLVETVNDTGPFFSADPRQSRTVAEQRVDQSMLALTRTRVNGEPGRFIDDDDVTVFKENVERNRLRPHIDLLCRRLPKINFVTASDDLPGPGGLLVEPNVPAADQLLNP